MTTQPSALSAEIADRGDAIYEAKIRSRFEQTHDGKVAAIDVNSEAFAIGETALEAADRLRTQQPDAQIWLIRVGSRYLRHMRSSSTR
jgi:23S rRNA maturation mini-RNase III